MVILIWMVSRHPTYLHYIAGIPYISIRSYLLEYTVVLHFMLLY